MFAASHDRDDAAAWTEGATRWWLMCQPSTVVTHMSSRFCPGHRSCVRMPPRNTYSVDRSTAGAAMAPVETTVSLPLWRTIADKTLSWPWLYLSRGHPPGTRVSTSYNSSGTIPPPATSLAPTVDSLNDCGTTRSTVYCAEVPAPAPPATTRLATIRRSPVDVLSE